MAYLLTGNKRHFLMTELGKQSKQFHSDFMLLFRPCNYIIIILFLKGLFSMMTEL